MTNKEIADAVGKSEGYIKNLFTGINEIDKDPALKDLLISHPGVTIKAIRETKGIPNRQDRLDLLEKRGKGEITLNEMRERAKTKKEGNPVPRLPIAAQDCPLNPLAANAGIAENQTNAKGKPEQPNQQCMAERPEASYSTALVAPAAPVTSDTAETASTQDTPDYQSSRLMITRKWQSLNESKYQLRDSLVKGVSLLFPMSRTNSS